MLETQFRLPKRFVSPSTKKQFKGQNSHENSTISFKCFAWQMADKRGEDGKILKLRPDLLQWATRKNTKSIMTKLLPAL